jgi:hypothetical protein
VEEIRQVAAQIADSKGAKVDGPEWLSVLLTGISPTGFDLQRNLISTTDLR